MLVCGSNTWPAGGEESAAVAIAANLTAAEAAVVAVRPTTATVVSVPLTMGAVTPERAVRKTVRVATIGPAGAGQHVSLFRFATATVTVTAPYPLAPLPPDTLFLCYITDAAGVLRFLSMPVLLPPPPSSEDAAAAAAVAAAAAAAAAASAAAEAADSGSDSGSGGGSAAPGGPTPDTGRPDSRYARPLFTLAMGTCRPRRVCCCRSGTPPPTLPPQHPPCHHNARQPKHPAAELATAGIMTLPSPELLHGWTRAAESKRIKRCETAAAAAAAEAAKAAAKAAAAKAAAAPRRRGPKKGCRGAYAAVAASAAEGDDGTLSSMLPPLPIVAAAPADVGMAADVLEVAAEEVEEDEEAAGSAPAGGAGAPASKRARTGGDGDGDDDEYDDWSSHYVMPARRARVPVAALVAASLLSAGTDAGDSRASYFLRPGSWAAASRPAAVPTPSPAPAGDSWSASMAPLIDGTVNLTRAHVHTAAGGGDYDSGWGYDNAGATPAGEVVLPLTSHVSTDAAGSWAINAPTPVAARPAGGAPPQWRSWTAAAAAAMEAAEMPALLPAAGLGDSCDSAPLPALDIELAACAAADGSVVPDGSATMRSAGSGSTGDLAAAAAASDSDASDAHLDCHPADGHAAAGLFTFPTATFNSLGSTAW